VFVLDKFLFDFYLVFNNFLDILTHVSLRINLCMYHTFIYYECY
jgi:hypothetical protein